MTFRLPNDGCLFCPGTASLHHAGCRITSTLLSQTQPQGRETPERAIIQTIEYLEWRAANGRKCPEDTRAVNRLVFLLKRNATDPETLEFLARR